MSRAEGNENVPRAMIHRRILDVAESNPDASIPAIADDVSGAAPSLVERVLDEYGDPAAEEEPAKAESSPVDEIGPEVAESATVDSADAKPETTDTADAEPEAADREDTDTNMVTENGSETAIEADDEDDADLALSEKQRTTLRAVHENPGGSQGDIADELDVTRATVSRRLNAIPGFDWSDRKAFAESVFGDHDGRDAGASDSDTTTTSASNTADATRETVDDATAADTAEKATPDDSGAASPDGTDEATAARLSDIDRRLSALEAGDDSGGGGAPLPPELAHKVVHACMESDRVSEDEELELLRALLAE